MKSQQPALIDQPLAPKAEAVAALEVQPLARSGGDSGLLSMIERLALSPDVPVDKLERLLAMQERVLAHDAKAEFDAAFAEMQGKLPVITERGEIEVDGVVRSKYARYEDIIEVVRPILAEHGFALRHQNRMQDGKQLIVGVLSHRSGHSEQDEFECPPDTSGKKNSIQAMGSTRSYGQRYTTNALLNIVTRGTDDDGKSATKQALDTPAPHGYADWITDLAASADEGLPKLTSTWNGSKLEYREHLLKTDRKGWEVLKQKAKAVTDKARS